MAEETAIFMIGVERHSCRLSFHFCYLRFLLALTEPQEGDRDHNRMLGHTEAKSL
jgi:hypothetical protein